MGLFRTCPSCHGKYLGPLCPACGAPDQTAADEALDPLRPGQVFHGLKILHRLAAGGMGVVYKAHHLALDRVVALKLLLPERSLVPELEERFLREARAMAKLSHPHIVTGYDAGKDRDLYFLTLEFVEGGTLRDRLQKGPCSVAEGRSILEPVLDAVAYAHRLGMIHRDLKPENILLTPDGGVKVTDFGLVKLTGPGSDTVALTQSGEMIGTAVYMAPEQILDPRRVDHRSDIYSLGVLAFEMLTGKLPVGSYEPPSQTASVPPAVDAVLLRALSREMEKRHESVDEFRNELMRAMEGERPAQTPPPPAAPRTARRVAVATLVLIALGLLLHWGGLPWIRSEKKRVPGRIIGTVSGPITALAAGGSGGHFFSGGSGSGIRMWSWKEGREVARLPSAAEVTLLSFHARGNLLASYDLGGTIQVWNVATRSLRHTWAVRPERVRAMSIHPEGRLLAGGDDKGMIRLWHVRTETEFRSWQAHSSAATQVACAPARTIVVSAGADGLVKIWDLKGKLLRTLTGHAAPIRSLAFAGDGKEFATGDDAGTIRLWDVKSGRSVGTLKGPRISVLSLSFHPTGGPLAAGGGDGSIRLWRVPEGSTKVELVGHKGPVRSVVYDAKGNTLASGGQDGTIRFWNVSRP